MTWCQNVDFWQIPEYLSMHNLSQHKWLQEQNTKLHVVLDYSVCISHGWGEYHILNLVSFRWLIKMGSSGTDLSNKSSHAAKIPLWRLILMMMNQWWQRMWKIYSTNRNRSKSFHQSKQRYLSRARSAKDPLLQVLPRLEHISELQPQTISSKKCFQLPIGNIHWW